MPVQCSCLLCGKQFSRSPRDLRRGGGKYCSWKCQRDSRRKSGNRVNMGGYVRIYESGGKTHAEHRAIMEAHIGRSLRDGEYVHHIDGNKTNNVISNLQIVTAKEHSQIHSVLNGRWSIAHECCIECGTTEHKHTANGLCRRCHGKNYQRERRKKYPGYRGASYQRT